MKKGLGLIIAVLLTLLCAAAMADVELNETNFPDANFLQFIRDERYDSNSDGKLSDNEISVIHEIVCNVQEIKSLKGIEYFSALEMLCCDQNQLTSLDVSKNTKLVRLDCYYNELTSLDLSKNTSLKILYCWSNQFTSLDVSKNTALENLECQYNKLTSLDICMNTALTELNCWNNQLMSLDVSKNTALTVLNCLSNQLTSLDISKNTKLVRVNCGSNKLTSLDVSRNTALTELYCYANQLESLDVSNNTALTKLNCFSNQLESLDVSRNIALTELNCGLNPLKNLDVSQNSNLSYLACQINQLTSLDLSKNTNLTELYVSANDIQTLDVSRNSKLKILGTEFTGIKELNVSSCPSLCESVKNNVRQTISASSSGWNEYGYYDDYHAWKEGDQERLTCNTTTKVIAGSYISDPNESTEPAEPSVGDIFTADGLKYKVTGKSTAAVTGAEKAKKPSGYRWKTARSSPPKRRSASKRLPPRSIRRCSRWTRLLPCPTPRGRAATPSSSAATRRPITPSGKACAGA